MAFFPRNFYSHEASSYTPLFRLLDEFDSYSRQSSGNSHHGRSAPPSWQPKFDVRETTGFYELHGELPGVNKEQVHIEFTEPQTMVIRGRVERSYTAGTPPADFLEDAPATRAITEGSENRKGSPHQAAVEDERDAAKGSSTKMVTKEAHKADKQPADTVEYWLSERSVGEFSRTFSFPSGIDQDAVTANFKDGILSIAVPKAWRHGSRRIAIN